MIEIDLTTINLERARAGRMAISAVVARRMVAEWLLTVQPAPPTDEEMDAAFAALKPEETTLTRDRVIGHAISVLVVAAALSIPGLLFAAWWFDDASLAAWAVVPFIIFMAG